MVQDDEGRWWAKSRQTGQWHYYDGNTWIQGTPPGYQSVTPDPVTDESPIRTSPALHPEGTEKGETRRRWALLWVLAAGLLAVVALVGMWTYLQGGDDTTVESANDAAGEGSPSEEAPKSAPGYQLVEDDSGNLSVEVPSGWEVVTGKESEDSETGGSSWSSFGVGSINSSISASTDYDAFHNTGGISGIYMVASRMLAQTYTDDQLVLGLVDLSNCEPDAVQDFDRPPYSGRMLAWNCSGNGARYLNLAVAPEGRECVVLLQIVMYSEADRDATRHILDTFEADCGGIA